METQLFLVEVLHHICRTFKEHAILKGGVELSLFSSPRPTNDLDFVFIPYESKKDIVDSVKACLENVSSDVTVKTALSSKNAKFFVKRAAIEIEVEISTSLEQESIPMNTAVIAKPLNLAPQVIRIMKPEVALAHKIAAWNERRLVRDLYDIYFWFSIQKKMPDLETLKRRLEKVESRLPQFRRRKTMSIPDLCHELEEFCAVLGQDDVDQELSMLPQTERQAFHTVLQGQINLLTSKLLAPI